MLVVDFSVWKIMNFRAGEEGCPLARKNTVKSE